MAEIEDALGEHIPYELGMLRYTYKELSVPITDQMLAKATIEAFWLHARNLQEFLWEDSTKGPRAKSIVGASYDHKSGNPGLAQEVNNQITHIGNKRKLIENEKLSASDRTTFLNALESKISYFLQILPSHLKSFWKEPHHLFSDSRASPQTIAPTNSNNTSSVDRVSYSADSSPKTTGPTGPTGPRGP